jgi:hypothetical protein
VAFRYFGNGDILDSRDLQKSGLYDIKDESITIFIHLDQSFVETMRRERGTSYYLLLVPKAVQMDQFTTPREAESLGVKLIDGRSGPP